MTRQNKCESEGQRCRRTGKKTLSSLEEQLSEPALLPGEDEHLYEAMAQAIRNQLAPKGILQNLACADIITLRWEILRHRRLRRKSVDRRFMIEILNIYRDSNLSDPEGKKMTDDDRFRLAMRTISDDPARRSAGFEYFDLKIDLDRDQILAEAFSVAPNVTLHDAKLNLLMRQHRQAMRDYDDLDVREARRNIPDAEIVGDTA